MRRSWTEGLRQFIFRKMGYQGCKFESKGFGSSFFQISSGTLIYYSRMENLTFIIFSLYFSSALCEFCRGLTVTKRNLRAYPILMPKSNCAKSCVEAMCLRPNSAALKRNHNWIIQCRGHALYSSLFQVSLWVLQISWPVRKNLRPSPPGQRNLHSTPVRSGRSYVLFWNNFVKVIVTYYRTLLNKSTKRGSFEISMLSGFKQCKVLFFFVWLFESNRHPISF